MASVRKKGSKKGSEKVPYFRYRPNIPELRMADLPESRVTNAIRPFMVCGIDYASPFYIRESKKRGNIPVSKVYIAVFVCFKTKAV